VIKITADRQSIQVMVKANAEHDSPEINAAVAAAFRAHTESPQVDSTSTAQGHGGEEDDSRSPISVLTTEDQGRRSVSTMGSAEGSSVALFSTLGSNWRAEGLSSSGILDPDAEPRRFVIIPTNDVTWNPSNYPGEADSASVDVNSLANPSAAGRIREGASAEPDGSIGDQRSSSESLVTLEDREVLRATT
jgi:hypothetical protein